MYTDCWLSPNCNKCDCESNFCLKRFKCDGIFELSLLPDSAKKDIPLRVDADGRDLENFKYLKNVQKNIDKFVESGENLYIHSPISGNGKTSWAIKLLKSYIQKIWHKSDIECRVLFIHVPRFLLALKDNISVKSDYVQFIKDNVANADLVVFDEIGIKAVTAFEHEHFLNIINTRLDANKSNIYTSNLSNSEVMEKLGPRLYSRIVNNSINIEIYGSDKRGVFK